MQTLIRIEMEKAEKRRKLLMVFLALIAVGSLGYFGLYYLTSSRSGGRMDELSGLVGSDVLSNMDKNSGAGYIASLSQKDTDEAAPEILEKYRTLYNSNRDLIGWIKIADTVIDYPVMQSDDNEYYLSHNFDRKDDKAGCLFLDHKCDAIRGNDNFIIYGHHLTSGRMFSSLSDYESESYYKKHPTIIFDTIYEEGTYQVMYAFRSRVYDETDVKFKYYEFIDTDSEQEFNSYMNEMKAASYYDTGITAVRGDKLLTLSTCDYKEENGRFVVVAKKIK
ncbi:MAG: class B sortase [Lachnospiraceae bacterium]|nr:class B sortase [Lachnospiraceae bacterium]